MTRPAAAAPAVCTNLVATAFCSRCGHVFSSAKVPAGERPDIESSIPYAAVFWDRCQCVAPEVAIAWVEYHASLRSTVAAFYSGTIPLPNGRREAARGLLHARCAKCLSTVSYPLEPEAA